MTPSEMGTSGGGCHSNATKDKVSEGTARLDRAMVCACSSKPLRSPITVCDLGYLLNKEDVIEYLLGKKLPAHLAHIRSLKSLHDATLHPNPSFIPTSLGHRQGADDDEPPFSCPIAMIPMNGRYPFVYIKPTGHVVSQRALKQVGGKICPITERAIGEGETIPINPSEDERNALSERLAAKKAAAGEAKRKGKELAARATTAAVAPAGSVPEASTAVRSTAPASSSAATDGDAKVKVDRLPDKATAKQPAKGLAGQGGGGGASGRAQSGSAKSRQRRARRTCTSPSSSPRRTAPSRRPPRPPTFARAASCPRSRARPNSHSAEA